MSDIYLGDAIEELGKNLKNNLLGEFYQVEGFAKQIQALMGRPESGLRSSQIAALLAHLSVQLSDMRKDILRLERIVYHAEGPKAAHNETQLLDDLRVGAKFISIMEKATAEGGCATSAAETSEDAVSTEGGQG